METNQLGTGCEFPTLDPFSAEATRFNQDMPKVVCEGVDWVNCYKSECQVTKEIIEKYRNIVCIYKDIVYVNDQKHTIGAPIKVIGEQKYYLNRSDSVKVSCSGFDKNGLGLVSSRWFGYKSGFRPVTTVVPPGREGSLNVLILGFDSTSRNGFIRRMPKSYQVLTEELQATVLKGFHILGDGTPTTLYPLLSGRSELEHPDARKKFAKGKFLDPKLFIFHTAKEDGYHTAYFEDMPWIGSFQLRYNGFSSCPADHYLRAFFLEETSYGAKWWSGSQSRYCVGAVPRYMMMLNLTRQFMDIEGKKFAFNFISDISHNDFNMISTADEDFAKYLKELKDSGKLKDTLLIVMGDHGSRFSPIRETYQGKIEERLPLMAIVLPETLTERRPEALSVLRANVDVLTTPFDVHTTILDAMGLKKLANDFTVAGSDLPRGMSLLHHIPNSRSCGQASILNHWCVCTKWNNVSVTDPLYKRSAKYLADAINSIIQEVSHLCVRRTLTSIDWVLRQGTNEDVLRFRRGMEEEGLFADFVTTSHLVKPDSEYYQAKIVMTPGRAVFEGTMKFYPRENRLALSAEDILRISAYGDEPMCVSDTHPHLNKFCYCFNKGLNSTTIVVR
ncbi:uncharacterized protein [Epargyreus clarus]|uniref:uncharacterized protein n=1 Tax=Epargyreus clarus TaxID=520877 RepID=UPI003C2E5934